MYLTIIAEKLKEGIEANILLDAIIQFLEQYTPETEHDLKQIVQLIEASETFELGSLQSDLDKVFEQVKTVDPNSDALKKYNYWKYLTTIKKNISNHPTPQWKIV